MSRPQLVLLAGPNGAGKSTYYQEFLRDSGLPFINADLMVRFLGLDNSEAAKAADLLRQEFVEARRSFISETVFSDPYGAKLDFLRRAIEVGFEVTLVFIGLENIATSKARVSTRVAEGGHDVPEGRLESRFPRTLKNLREALGFVPLVKIYDNSLVEEPFRLIAVSVAGEFHAKAEIPRWLALALSGEI